MKIGDKVRFLSEVGGGIVTGFQGKDIALVEDADGFDIPMPVRECVVIDADDYNIKRKPVAQKDVPDAAKSKGAVQTVKKSMEEEEDERPITYRAAERKGGDVLNVMLAFVPQDIKAISSTGFDAYIIFVVQMQDVRYFTPNIKTHPAFGEALQYAKECGVNILAFDCKVTPDSMSISSQIPVYLV